MTTIEDLWIRECIVVEHVEEDDGWRAYCHGHVGTGPTAISAVAQAYKEFSGVDHLQLPAPAKPARAG